MSLIKIILNNKRILLTEDYQAAMQQFSMNNAFIMFNFTRQKASDLVDLLMISELEDAIIVGDPEKNLDTLKRAFRVIKYSIIGMSYYLFIVAKNGIYLKAN